MSAPSSPLANPQSPLISDDDDEDDEDDEDDHSGTGKQSHQRQRHHHHRISISGLSFNDPNTGNTRSAYLFPLFLIIYVATMTDRCIIAGASREFSAFVSSAHDSPAMARENPDAGIGLLQGELSSSFSQKNHQRKIFYYAFVR